jgi:TonB family protein
MKRESISLKTCVPHYKTIKTKKQKPEITQQELPKAPEVNKTEPLVSDTIFAVVEKMPEFPGGKKALMNYLKENIHYPEQAKKEGIHGRVFVNFIVEKDGSISGVKILRGIGHGCDEETVRVVRAMPKWVPGEQRGQKVRVSFNLPIKFISD